MNVTQWAEMLEKEFAGALTINSELEAAKKATGDSLLKSTSMVYSFITWTASHARAAYRVVHVK